MCNMNETFPKWVQEELDRRGWSRSEAARRGGFSASMLDKVINRHASPGLDFCVGLSRAFGISAVEVLQRAGLLPPSPRPTQRWLRLEALWDRLTDEDQERLVQIARLWARDPG